MSGCSFRVAPSFKHIELKAHRFGRRCLPEPWHLAFGASRKLELQSSSVKSPLGQRTKVAQQKESESLVCRIVGCQLQTMGSLTEQRRTLNLQALTVRES